MAGVLQNVSDHVREEVASIVLARPFDRVSPAFLRWFGHDAVVYNEGQVLLRLERRYGLDQFYQGSQS